jgi:hypothetical protein
MPSHTKDRLWVEMIDCLVSGGSGPVTPHNCLTIAKIIGPCTFRFYIHRNQPWCEITWEDESSVTIGLA